MVFFGKEKMVDLLFEAMTHSAVKSGLINGRAVLRVYMHIQGGVYIHYLSFTEARTFANLFRNSAKCLLSKLKARFARVKFKFS